MINIDTQILTLIAPELVIFIGGLLMLLVGVFQKEDFVTKHMHLGRFILLLAFAMLLLDKQAMSIFSSMVTVNSYTTFVKGIILLSSIATLWMASGYYRNMNQLPVMEFPTILLLSVGGMMCMVSANSLITLYMGLELQSLALYILASIHRDNQKSSEAGLKYFVLGSVASGILLFGCSLVYGFTGTVNFETLAMLGVVPLSDGTMTTLSDGAIVGLVMIMIGFCFKISAVPFHMWTPDVYEGAPTPVTAFFATAPKVAAVALLVRLLADTFSAFHDEWSQIIIFVAVASMVVGALGAMAQTNVKRLIAYSSIGHVGFILLGLVSGSPQGVQAILFYLCIYVVMSIGFFACIMMMRQKSSTLENIYDLSGLGTSKPLMALVMVIFMFSMAGIPPLAGFFGKFYVFKSLINDGWYVLAVIGVLSSVIAAFYYLRIVKIMYFDEISVRFEVAIRPELKIIAGFAALINVCFILFYSPLLEAVDAASKALF